MLFGSAVKGGIAQDLDIALLSKGEVNLISLKKSLEQITNKKVDLQLVNISTFSPLWLTLIKEGYSVNKETYLADLYGIKPMVLYKYSLQKLDSVQKVQFGRGIKKVLGKEGEYLSRSVVLIPLTLKNRMMEFLKHWNVYYECREYELVPFLRKEEA